MAQTTEHRLALQAARGIAALDLAGKLKELCDVAQSSRDEARIKFDRANELANDTFTRAVIVAYNDFARQADSLRDESTEDDEDDDY